MSTMNICFSNCLVLEVKAQSTKNGESNDLFCVCRSSGTQGAVPARVATPLEPSENVVQAATRSFRTSPSKQRSYLCAPPPGAARARRSTLGNGGAKLHPDTSGVRAGRPG